MPPPHWGAPAEMTNITKVAITTNKRTVWVSNLVIRAVREDERDFMGLSFLKYATSMPEGRLQNRLQKWLIKPPFTTSIHLFCQTNNSVRQCKLRMPS
jgi:hypothetical protein